MLRSMFARNSNQGRRVSALRLPCLLLVLLLDFHGAASTFAMPRVRRCLQSSGEAQLKRSTTLASIAPRLHHDNLQAAFGHGNKYAPNQRGHHRHISGGGSAAGTLPSLFVRFSAQGRVAARLLGDFTAAALASMMVSPFISIADRAVIQSASGSMTMENSVRQGLRVMLTKPKLFLARPDFLFTFGLFGGTYLAANAISTIASEIKRSDTWPRFFGTTAVNMPGSIIKDQALTKIFGAVGGAASVPMASFALFTVRDLATMAAAFTLPTPMSAKMQEELGVNSGWADSISQLVSPGLVQVFSTPVHILGLDMYNHPGSSMSERVKVVQKSFAPAIGLRIARIGVAFGLGGLGNTAIRKHLHAAVASREA